MNCYAILIGGQWLLADYDGDLFHRMRYPAAEGGWLDVTPRHPDPNLDTMPAMALRVSSIEGVRASDFQLERDQYLEALGRAVDRATHEQRMTAATERVARGLIGPEDDGDA
jgi:hypothetical protein